MTKVVANEKKLPRHPWWSNPFLVFSISFVFALIYTLLPSYGKVSIFFKSLWWNVAGVSAIVELWTISVPDIPNKYYELSYVLGFCTSPTIQLLVALCGGRRLANNYFFYSFTITSSAAIPSTVFFFWCLLSTITTTTAATATDDDATNTYDDKKKVIKYGPPGTSDIYDSCIDYAPIIVKGSGEPSEAEYGAVVVGGGGGDDSNDKSSSAKLGSSSHRRRHVDCHNHDVSRSRGEWERWRFHIENESRAKETTNTDKQKDSSQNECSAGIVNSGDLNPLHTSLIESQDTSDNASLSVLLSSDIEYVHNRDTDVGTEMRSVSVTLPHSTTTKGQQFVKSSSIDLEMANKTQRGDKTQHHLVNNPSMRPLPPVYLWFLPRYILQTRGFMNGNKMEQWCLNLVFLLLYNGYYDILCVFTEYFRHHDGDNGDTHVYLFFAFIALGLVFRLALKRVGMALDSNKYGSASMYFIGEAMALYFYFTFYRVLYASISNWLVFVGFQALHLATEWMSYPLRCSEYFAAAVEKIEDRFPRAKGAMMPSGQNRWDWVEMVTLDFGIRCVVMVSACVGMMFLLLAIDYVPWVHNRLAQHGNGVLNTCSFIVISTILELANAHIMNTVFFKPNDMNVVHKVLHCFSSSSFSFVCGLIAANLFINPVFTFTIFHVKSYSQ